MSEAHDELVTLDFEDAEGIWNAFTPPGPEDILARPAFERELRFFIGLEDEGLYFRPGGWTIDLPVTVARVAIVAAVLAAGFQLAGLEDLDREVIIATAGLIAGMDLRPVRLARRDRQLADRLDQAGLAGVPLSAAQARRALPKARRRDVTPDEMAEVLERLVAAGLADRHGHDEWTLRAKGSEAWIRLRLSRDSA
ncbi:MAG: hypothetical protein IT193_16700 [Propionibacteriaceae bacterium]|nr:hypothetical protein [Propionibacteriaceae bacterium]